MRTRTPWIVGAATLLMLLLGGAAASAQPALGVGPLQASQQGNPLLEASCDIFVGGNSSRSFIARITASPPPLGGASVPIAQQFFPNVPPGQTRTLFASIPFVTNAAPLFCIVDDLNPDFGPQDLFATLSILQLFDDSIETVVGASGNTAIPN